MDTTASAAFGPRAPWTNRYAALGPSYYTELPAQGLPEPHWIAVSDACARTLGWPEDWWHREDWNALSVFSGNALWAGMRPLATVYSGHQFGVWAGQLGDGRALWLGEVETPDGPMELQLKGSGLTPYSRMGDGRAVLRSSIREFLCSEAMHALGIPTTRALCLTGSALPVRRERIETAAMVTRVAPSFVRFGHFEHFSHHFAEHDTLRQLLDFVIDYQLPACREAATPPVALLAEVARRTAELIAQWQAVGFCHGVLNTDNMSILGLTIDYGPYGFLDGFDPYHVCNHSDDQGRYAYARQPQVGYWNLHALARALLPLCGDEVDALSAALESYKLHFQTAMSGCLRAKLGLAGQQDDDDALAEAFLELLAAERVDYTIAWRRLATLSSAPGQEAAASPIRDMFIDRPRFDAWAARYAQRLRSENSSDAARAARMQRVNPKYVLRNHLAEEAIRRAEAGDFTEVQRLLKVLQRPYDEQPEHEADAGFPPDWAQHLEVSCSS
jgi:uncharacterized protein YdiU (UPF0061 family)